eukprot:14884078-Alexandrium_andersonii.AAC.1
MLCRACAATFCCCRLSVAPPPRDGQHAGNGMRIGICAVIGSRPNVGVNRLVSPRPTGCRRRSDKA